jgi:hypothetical protein
MSYIDYLKCKLHAEEPTSLVDNALKYLGFDYPINDSNLKGYEIVDGWIEKVKSKWNIEFKTLNLSQTNILGKLEPKQDGFIINLNKNLHTTQKRFTIAHEVAHVLSYDTSKKWPLYEVVHSKLEEYFCDRIARGILLPKNLIDFSKINLDTIDRNQIDFIKGLWPEFKVSPWQIIKKVFEDKNSNTIVGIMWEYSPKESCLRIIEHHHPRDIFIPKKKRILLDNLLQKRATNLSPELAFNSNDIFQGEDLIQIGSLYKKKLLSTAFPIKTKAALYVIQIIKL